MEHKQRTVNVRLDNVAMDGYDAVYLVSGNNWDLRHKSPENQKAVGRIVKRSLDDGLVIACIGSGIDVLQETKHLNACSFESRGVLHFGVPEATRSTVIKGESKHAKQLAQESLKILATHKSQYESRLPWWQSVL